jgi:hypothetical protein
MRLPAPFIKLPLRFDVARLKAEIGQFSESEWRGHPQGFAGNSALVLVSHDGGENDDTSGSMAPTPRLAQCQYLQQVMASFQTVIGRSRLMRLEPGAEVTTHTDIDFYWRDRIRIHLPIVTDPSVRFNCDGVEIHMAEGEAWIFDNWRPHRVINGSGIRRVHLVIDSVGSAAFWRLASGGIVVRGDVQPATDLVTPEIDGPARELAYERNNRASLTEPAGVKAAIHELVADLRSARQRSPQQAELENTLLDFSNEWQALWAQFAQRPERHGSFAVLIEDSLRRSGDLGRDIRLPSNSTPVTQVLSRFLPAMFDGWREWQRRAPRPQLERPVIIVSAPRSGSTLLFETLKRHPGLWTLGDESHAEIENIPGLSPQDRGFASNALGAVDVTPEVRHELLGNFMLQLRDARDRRWLDQDGSSHATLRLLEKTPKNALRIPFLDALFPDALYVFIYRDAAENLGSMLDAWQSGRFVTYADLPDWSGPPWSLLLPPAWQSLAGQPLAEVVALQWRAANEIIMRDLAKLPKERWRVLDYAALTTDPAGSFARAVDFIGLAPAPDLQASLAAGLPLSKYTLSPPAADKWRRHEAALRQPLAALGGVEAQLKALGNRL